MTIIVPLGTWWKNHFASARLKRTQPWLTGCPSFSTPASIFRRHRRGPSAPGTARRTAPSSRHLPAGAGSKTRNRGYREKTSPRGWRGDFAPGSLENTDHFAAPVDRDVVLALQVDGHPHAVTHLQGPEAEIHTGLFSQAGDSPGMHRIFPMEKLLTPAGRENRFCADVY